MSTELCSREIHILKLYGHLREYQDGYKGFPLKIYSVYRYAANFMVCSLLFQFLLSGKYTFDEFVDGLSVFFAVGETVFLKTLLLIFRKRFVKLFERISEMLGSGESLSEESYKMFSKLHDRFFNVYLYVGYGTIMAFILRALVKTLFEGHRTFPFNVR